MTRASIEMDNLMPDLTGDFDFGAFLDFPPDDVDQGVGDGKIGHKSGLAFDLMPTSHNPALLDPSENVEALQSTSFQLQTKNVSHGFGYGAEIGASGRVQAGSATALKPQTIAMRECGEVCIIPSDQESSQSYRPDPAGLEAPENHCTCIGCLKIFWYGGQSPNSGGKLKCHFPGCLTSATSGDELWYHETRHYGTRGNYKCLEQDCKAVTKNFYELKRHYKKHCTSPDKEIFSCPVSWCKYSGTNGFLRKDKLKSHYRNIHEGKPGPVKADRVIKPATLKPRVSSVGNGPSKQNE